MHVNMTLSNVSAMADALLLLQRSAIRLPESTYPLWDALPPEVVEQGKLSQLQLEGVLYACTKHQQFLPTGERASAAVMERSCTWQP